MPLAKPPLWEMSLAIQTSELGGLTPQQALAIRDEIMGELPRVELQPPLGVLGATESKLVDLPSLQPRWWFLSEDDERVVQVQHDTVAVNWRRRADNPSYPGFDAMLSDAQRHLKTWKRHSDVKELVRPIGNLFYDNIWDVRDGESTGSIFRFWKNLGVSGRFTGPQMTWTLDLTDKGLSPPARLEMTAELGAIQRGDEVQRVARVRLNGTFHAPDEAQMWVEFGVIHEQIRTYLEVLVTDETRAQWQP